jgi:hypothetical protein
LIPHIVAVFVAGFRVLNKFFVIGFWHSQNNAIDVTHDVFLHPCLVGLSVSRPPIHRIDSAGKIL